MVTLTFELATTLLSAIHGAKNNVRLRDGLQKRVERLMLGLETASTEKKMALVAHGVMAELAETLTAAIDYCNDFQDPAGLRIRRLFTHKRDQDRLAELQTRLSNIVQDTSLVLQMAAFDRVTEATEKPVAAPGPADKAWELLPPEYEITKVQRGVMRKEVVLGRGTFGAVFQGTLGAKYPIILATTNSFFFVVVCPGQWQGLEVAVKTINLITPRDEQLFLNEVTTLSRIRHPHIGKEHTVSLRIGPFTISLSL